MAGSIGDPTKWFELAQKHWHRRAAVIAAVVLFVSVVTAVIWVLAPVPLLACVIIYVIGIVLVIFCWWWSNRLARTPKNKVGFVVSLHAGGEDERTKIKEDFILTLHELLKGGPSGRSFEVITVPEHIAEGIVDQDDAQALRIRCRAHFVIYGRVRLRTIAGSPEHVLHLEGLVAHKAMPEAVNERFAKEFGELLPRRVRIGAENDVFSFAFTSEWINLAARYIIGIAAEWSGDLNYAEQLYKDVERLLVGKDQAFPIFAKLKQRIPLRLTEIQWARAIREYNRWLRTRDRTAIEKMGQELSRVPLPHMDDYNIVLAKAIYLFLSNRDVKNATAILKKCKAPIDDGTWLYSLAFLEAYVGNLRAAIRRYRSAMKLRVVGNTISEVEEFICWVVEEEPKKYQLHYCLGFINWKVKGDMTQAERDFERFLSAGEETEFTNERALARQWLVEIRSAKHDCLEEGAQASRGMH